MKGGAFFMQVKIKELPSKSFAEITDNDIMVIEDSSDTKQIPVSALKLFFSSDNKLNALSDKLDSKFEELQDLIAQINKDISSTDDALDKRINNLYNDHEATKQRLGALKEDVVDVQNHIHDMDTHFETVDTQIKDLQDLTANHSKLIKALQDTVNNHEGRIVNLEQDNVVNKQAIIDIRQSISDLDKKFTNEIARLDRQDEDNKESNIEYSDQLYNDCMKYIDYYHHIHTNPPNFDEPYKGDPIVASYIHPIGTIYTTSDPEFDPSEWFPGAWKYVGVGASYNDDMTERIDYYTYIRMK